MKLFPERKSNGCGLTEYYESLTFDLKCSRYCAHLLNETKQCKYTIKKNLGFRSSVLSGKDSCPSNHATGRK